MQTELVVGGGAGKRSKGRKKGGKRKKKGKRNKRLDAAEAAAESAARFSILVTKKKLEDARRRIERLTASNEAMQLEEAVNSKPHPGSFDAMLQSYHTTDAEQTTRIRNLVQAIADQRGRNVELDAELTATMKAKIEQTHSRTAAYNELKAHHKDRMEFLRKNESVETELQTAKLSVDEIRAQVSSLVAQIRRFDTDHPNLVPKLGGRPRNLQAATRRHLHPPGLARVIMLVAWRNLYNPRFLLDCYRALDDLLTPEFQSSAELASDLGKRLIQQTLLVHGNDPDIVATTCRALRKLVSLQPQTIDHWLRVGTIGHITQFMDLHWWSAVVQEAGTDALIGLIPRKVMEACRPDSVGARLANIVRDTYGKLRGAHVAVGVLRVAVKAHNAKTHPHGVAAGYREEGVSFDPTHSDGEDDDSNLYLLKQRLIGFTSQMTRALKESQAQAERKQYHDSAIARKTPRPLNMQALFATLLLLLEDRAPAPTGVNATRAKKRLSQAASATTSGTIAALRKADAPTHPGAPPTQSQGNENAKRKHAEPHVRSLVSNLLAVRRASTQLCKSRPSEVGEVVSAVTGIRVQQGVQATAAVLNRLLKYIVTDAAALKQVCNYRCLSIIVLLIKNQHHVPPSAEVGETACKVIACMLTQQPFSRRLLRRMDVLTAVIKIAYLHATNHRVVTAAAPIIEYFGGNHSACLRLLATEADQAKADTEGPNAGTFAKMSHVERVALLNEALERSDVGEVPSSALAEYDALLHRNLRPDRPLSRPAGRNLDFKKMFSRGLLVLRAEEDSEVGSRETAQLAPLSATVELNEEDELAVEVVDGEEAFRTGADSRNSNAASDTNTGGGAAGSKAGSTDSRDEAGHDGDGEAADADASHDTVHSIERQAADQPDAQLELRAPNISNLVTPGAGNVRIVHADSDAGSDTLSDLVLGEESADSDEDAGLTTSSDEDYDSDLFA